MTLPEYLSLEERSPIKHEYVAGEVFAMSGVTTRHSLITLNIVRALHQPMRSRGCRVFASDVKVQHADRVYYPDVLVACGKAAAVDLVVEAPSLIAEVTSPSTRGTDRREKLDTCLRIATLGAYLIVDQRRRHVLCYTRDADGAWVRSEHTGEESLTIPALGLDLRLDDIYDGVELPPLAVAEAEEWD